MWLLNLHSDSILMYVFQTSSWDECALEPRPNTAQAPPPLDIPKELFAIVDFLLRHGIEKVCI